MTDIIDGTANNGGKTDYYKLPEHAEQLSDLIEHRNMNFQIGEIFKAAWRYNDDRTHSNPIRDLNKITFFAEREKIRLSRLEKSRGDNK